MTAASDGDKPMSKTVRRERDDERRVRRPMTEEWDRADWREDEQWSDGECWEKDISRRDQLEPNVDEIIREIERKES